MTTDPADTLRAAADRAGQSTDPLHAAIASWLDVAALTYNAAVKAAANVWDDPAEAAERDAFVAKQTDHAALAVARVVLGTTTPAAETTTVVPADLAAGLLAAADEIAGIDFHPNARARSLDIATGLVRRLHRLAAEAQQPAPAATDALADCATEYRVPVPENGGEQLLVRRQSVAQGVGWAVSVMARGGGRAWTTEGWQEAISALSVDRLFCWPDAATAVDEARRALTAPADTEEPTP